MRSMYSTDSISCRRCHLPNETGAIDEVRAGEARQMKADGYEPILKHSRWCLLKRRENLTEKQTVKLSELLKYNLRSVRAHLLREAPVSLNRTAVLRVRRSNLGWKIPRSVVYANDAEPTRTDEEGRPYTTQPSRADSQLVSGQRGAFLWRCRGPFVSIQLGQQSQTDHQKIVRLSHLQCH